MDHWPTWLKCLLQLKSASLTGLKRTLCAFALWLLLYGPCTKSTTKKKGVRSNSFSKVLMVRVARGFSRLIRLTCFVHCFNLFWFSQSHFCDMFSQLGLRALSARPETAISRTFLLRTRVEVCALLSFLAEVLGKQHFSDLLFAHRAVSNKRLWISHPPPRFKNRWYIH